MESAIFKALIVAAAGAWVWCFVSFSDPVRACLKNTTQSFDTCHGLENR